MEMVLLLMIVFTYFKPITPLFLFLTIPSLEHCFCQPNVPFFKEARNARKNRVNPIYPTLFLLFLRS